MKLTSVTNNKTWDDFVRNSPHGTIFMESDFLSSLDKEHEKLFLMEKDQPVAAAVIFFDNDGKPFMENNLYIYYQGILIKQFKDKAGHQQLTSNFKYSTIMIEEIIKKYRQVCFCQPWTYDDLRAFQWHNYHTPQKGMFDILLRYTGVIPLKQYADFDDYYQSIRKLRKREFVKAKTNNLIISESDDIEELLALEKQTYARQDICLTPDIISYMQTISKTALEKKYGKLLKATTVEGKLASAMLFVSDNRTVNYLFAANSPEFRNTGASTFLILQAIEEAISKGFEYFDFCGVNSPNRGDYKISFNAEIKPFFLARFPKP